MGKKFLAKNGESAGGRETIPRTGEIHDALLLPPKLLPDELRVRNTLPTKRASDGRSGFPLLLTSGDIAHVAHARVHRRAPGQFATIQR